jgi:hypothetical protein
LRGNRVSSKLWQIQRFRTGPVHGGQDGGHKTLFFTWPEQNEVRRLACNFAESWNIRADNWTTSEKSFSHWETKAFND